MFRITYFKFEYFHNFICECRNSFSNFRPFHSISYGLWRSGLMHQSDIPVDVGLSPAGSKMIAVGKNFLGWICKGYTLGHKFHPKQVINWVAGLNVDCISE